MMETCPSWRFVRLVTAYFCALSLGAVGALAVGNNCTSGCYFAQREALLQLFLATNNGPGWVNDTGWNGVGPEDHCAWAGISCCDYHTNAEHTTEENTPALTQGICPLSGVVMISLSYNGLSGKLPDNTLLALAPTLELLDLSYNSLVGTLPSSLSSLSVLQQLALDYNNFSGPLPPSLGSLTLLLGISAPGNALSGTVPVDALGNLSRLQWVDLSHNSLTGSPPATLLLLKSLVSLTAAHNFFSGTIPNIVFNGSMQGYGLQILYLGHNELIGSIPDYLGKLPCGWMDLSGNKLTGSVPRTFASSASLLLMLALDHNMLTGSLPAGFPPTAIKELLLSHNQLSGTISPSFIRARNLYMLDLSVNPNLTGSLPDAMPLLEDLEHLDIVNTSMRSTTLTLPAWLNFSSARTIEGAPAFAYCPVITISSTALHQTDLTVRMSPYYYNYQECSCIDGYVASYVSAGGAGGHQSMTCDLKPMSDSSTNRFPWWAGLVVALGGACIMAAMFAVAWLSFRPQIAKYRAILAKKQPPGAGKVRKPVTLVLTDVEGSTELWEWDTDVMSSALDIHDRLLRRYMTKFFGYEVMTEGDAFLIAVHRRFTLRVML